MLCVTGAYTLQDLGPRGEGLILRATGDIVSSMSLVLVWCPSLGNLREIVHTRQCDDRNRRETAAVVSSASGASRMSMYTWPDRPRKPKPHPWSHANTPLQSRFTADRVA